VEMASKEEESDSDDGEQMQFKIIVIGDGAVGKTSIVNRFCKDHFASSYKQTIGLDFFMKRITLPGEVDVTMQVWDIGGQTIGGKMIGNYVFGSHAVLLAYDITNAESFHNLVDWLDVVKKIFKDSPTKPYLGLLANKTDLSHMRAVNPEKHSKFAADNDMFSYYVSAKNGDNVNSTFYRVAADLAGIVLSKPEIEVQTKVVAAIVVDHAQNELKPVMGSAPVSNAQSQTSVCVLQ